MENGRPHIKPHSEGYSLMSDETAAPETNAAPSEALLPAVELAPPAAPAAKPSRAPVVPGSFAASIRAMLDEARQGIAQARTDGLAKVGAAVGKLNEAKAATAHVTGQMVATIESEAADVMAELGQFSNALGGENE